MSRAAATKASKEEGKANRVFKEQRKEYEKACGLTGEIKKVIGADVLLCTGCGATQMGPTVCECKGGKVRPGPDDDGLKELVIAAKARMASATAERIKECNRNASAVAKEREKKKEARDLEKNDLNGEFQGDGVELLQIVEFPVGKLGMEIENNAVSKVLADQAAAGLKVQVGWIIHKIGGDIVEPNKKAIVKATMAGMKNGPVQFGFRVPIQDGFLHCKACNKFLDRDSFSDDQVANGPGVQLCYSCEEFADMGDAFD